MTRTHFNLKKKKLKEEEEEAEGGKDRSRSEHRREGKEDMKRNPSSDSDAFPRQSIGRRRGQSDGLEGTRKDEAEKERGRSRRGRDDAGSRENESSRRDEEENFRTRDRDYERRRRSEREGDNKYENGHRRRQNDNRDDEDVRHRERKSQRQFGDSKIMRAADDAKLNEDSKMSKQERNMITQTANLGRSGGVYIPAFKLARMMKEIQDKSSVECQRMT